MRAAVLKSPKNLMLLDLPEPSSPPGGALIRVEACAVCGTDIKMLDQGHRDLQYPRILGHEVVGRIEEIDPEAKAGCPSELKAGELVQLWPGIACGCCPACLQGADNRCQKMRIIGFSCDGGFAERLALPRQSLSCSINPLPEGADPVLFTLTEPLACCVNGQEQARLSEGESVLIWGGGPIGALHALLAELKGAEKILVAERLPGRIGEIRRNTSAQVIDLSPDDRDGDGRDLFREAERTILSETDGRGVDAILTATPEIKINQWQMSLLAPGGRICIFSGPRPGDDVKMLDLRSMHYLEQTITGSYGCSSRHNRLAARLLLSGQIKADWIITKRTDLPRIEEAFAHSSRRAGFKSVVCFA
ncbi:MAG TPA: alcohol dehydrogenase catalytic domain-containing protein [Methanothrix sp.]|nr:alcohol dehydrogenase catalytic domain-containing protein [Methanothrix sp.]